MFLRRNLLWRNFRYNCLKQSCLLCRKCAITADRALREGRWRDGRLLTDAQWEKIRRLLPKRRKRPHGGRPRADDRKVLEGILWIECSGARRCDLHEECPSPSTCWRRLRGGARGLVGNLARVPKRIERTPAIEVERIVYGRQFRSGEKGDTLFPQRRPF